MHAIRAIALSAATAVAASASAQVIRVSASAPPGGDGLSWPTAMNDLQQALAASAAEIWVASGVYVPGAAETDAFALRSGVAIYGGFSGSEGTRDERDWQSNVTVLSGDVNQDDVYGSPVWYQGWNINTANSRHVVTAQGVDGSAVLDGFTIRAGYSTFDYGAGMQIVGGAPHVANCTFTRNLSGFGHGGAMYVLDGGPAIMGCRFIENYVHLGQGAGIYVAGAGAPVITECTFTANRCVGTVGGEATGAAISNHAAMPLEISHCLFQLNESAAFFPSGDSTGTYGGAVYHMGAGMTLSDCTFKGNWSNAGGAVWSWNDVLLVNCTFTGNHAPEYQAQQGGWGGIGGAVGGSSFFGMTITMVNCTVAGNTAEAGAGLRVVGSAAADISNCIFWNNTDNLGTIGVSQIRGAHASYSDVQNFLIGQSGEDPPDPADYPGCIDADPLLAAPQTGDVHLATGSPCIDAGDNAAVPAWVNDDHDGQPRFADDPAVTDSGAGAPPIVDMGADERVPGDVNNDGAVNVTDLLAVLAAWGPCESCPQDIDGDGMVGVTDLLAVLANWG